MMDRTKNDARPPAFRAPPALRPGSRLAVIAPSSPFPEDHFRIGVERLRERYEVSWDEGLFAKHGYLAGDDARRLEELRAAITDPAIDGIVAARGGYGATRLLPDLDVALVTKHAKPLIGFSDVTALHSLWARAGLRSLHGAMVAALGRADAALMPRWFAAVEGGVAKPLSGLGCIAPGRGEGPLVGGNLAVLAALVGTGFEPPLAGAVLFLEDIGERPYRIDRTLTTLRQAGWLSRIEGVALGHFTDCDTGDDGISVEAVLRERLGGLGVPVISGVPSGHVADNVELPFGAPVVVDGDEGVLTFAEGAFLAPGRPRAKRNSQ
ncbi:MAG: LD-carboxypeptidase [Deltaproteobacteria bacterium]|nr:LD-carboxypeptidase [Deltaproteobacteria bacterium]